MHSYALVLASLCASALAFTSLTAYDRLDSACKGNPIGNEIVLPEGECMVYQPEQPDAYINIKWLTQWMKPYYNVRLFNDSNCRTGMVEIQQTSANLQNMVMSSCENVVSIHTNGPWGSAMRGGETDTRS